MNINEMRDNAHENARSKGWWDNEPDEINFGEKLMLIVSEASEALEEWRNGHDLTETYYNDEKPTKPEGVPSELADIVIRIGDLCGRAGIDLEAAIEEKMAYNSGRPYRHGGKRA